MAAFGVNRGSRQPTEAFLGLFFFFSYCTVEGSEGAEEDSISASEGRGEAIGEASSDGSERLDGGLDLNRAPEEEVDSSDISS